MLSDSYFDGLLADDGIDYAILGALNNQTEQEEHGNIPSSLSVDPFGDMDVGRGVSVVGQGGFKPSVTTTSQSVLMIPPTAPLRAAPVGRRVGTGVFPVALSSPTLTMAAAAARRGEPVPDEEAEEDDKESEYEGEGGRGGKTRRPLKKSKLDAQQEPQQLGPEKNRLERRERNREHAKRSRLRKKVLLDVVQDELTSLRRENMMLRQTVAERIPHLASQILSDCTVIESELLADSSSDSTSASASPVAPPPAAAAAASASPASPASLAAPASPAASAASAAPAAATATAATAAAGAGAWAGASISLGPIIPPVARNAACRELLEPDFRLMQALVASQHNFVLSDPSLPDNPIVYCSDGFCKLSGYKRADVLGRNCRFMQGPATDKRAVAKIREAVAEGRDITVCLLNYKANGTPFWNQFFVAAIRNSKGQIVNFVSVQCEVNGPSISQIKSRVKRIPVA